MEKSTVTDINLKTPTTENRFRFFVHTTEELRNFYSSNKIMLHFIKLWKNHYTSIWILKINQKYQSWFFLREFLYEQNLFASKKTSFALENHNYYLVWYKFYRWQYRRGNSGWLVSIKKSAKDKIRKKWLKTEFSHFNMN